MRTEGVYTYLCKKCGTFFAVVSRFAVAGDYSESLLCPKCNDNAAIHGEGYINHEVYEAEAITIIHEAEERGYPDDNYPNLLTAKHVAEIIGVSKRVAYEIMELKEFPLIRLGRLKRVRKDKFYEWLNEGER